VTLQPRFVSTIDPNNKGAAANYYSFRFNGQQYLGGKDQTKGYDEVFTRSITFNAAVGQKFQIAYQVASEA
jgi:hypothetical protein